MKYLLWPARLAFPWVLLMTAVLLAPHRQGAKAWLRMLYGPITAVVMLLLVMQSTPHTPCVGYCETVPTVQFGN